MIAKYLGGLPSINRKESFKDTKMEIRKGQYKNEFAKKQETPMASIMFLFSGTCKYDLRNQMTLSILDQALDMVYTAEHMQKIKEYMLKKYKDAQKENSYWLGNLDEYFYTGIDYTKDYETLVNSITAKDVQEFLAKLMKQNNEIQVIMTVPEEEAK